MLPLVDKSGVTYVDKGNTLALSKFAATEDKDFWNLRLIDQNGNHSKPGMMIVTTEGFNRLKEKNPSLKELDCFIVDLGYDFDRFMKGTGAVGIRGDGEGNTIKVPAAMRRILTERHTPPRGCFR
ncbi:hypothetical protein [Selenomonas sp. ND2010]|uniref:hypothetical protein n=1 Tax=Selenomonas sp. ND2010 TaxID=1410618 RepID=UPI000A476CFC|nr:hypothetical protein [Selenomonas sp. ND2010]